MRRFTVSKWFSNNIFSRPERKTAETPPTPQRPLRKDATLMDPLPEHQKIAIFGLGESGIASAHLLASFDKELIVSDTAPEERRAELSMKLPVDTQLILERNDFDDATALVTSPGLPPSHPVLQKAQQAGLPILAELELAARTTKTPIIAITGTDGKTTITTLVSHLLTRCGRHNRMGGNIGIPFSHIVQDAPTLHSFVIETSAFQLPFCPTLKPHVLIASNIAEDHTEYFNHVWEDYVSTKRKPLANMKDTDFVVLNASDPEVRTWERYTHAPIFWYAALESDIPKNAINFAYLSENNKEAHIYFDGEHHNVDLSTLPFIGKHNKMNLLASAGAVLCLGCEVNDIFEAVLSYKTPPHRIEKIVTVQDVLFIDDSKATNPHAATAALNALNKPLILIAGGVDKGLNLKTWIETMRRHVLAVYTIGELAKRLTREMEETELNIPIYHVETLEEATHKAFITALELGADNVLLSPACSSYDMFKNYEHRGEVFAHEAIKISLAFEKPEEKRLLRR